MSYEATNEIKGQPMTNPASEGSTFDQVYEEINVPCPTCRGTGRISRDDASLQDLVTMTTGYKRHRSDGDQPLPIDKTIFRRIKEEMQNHGVSQTVFAAVAFNKTQGLLSEILRRGATDTNLVGGRCFRENLEQIDAFLKKPTKERLRLYAEYKQKTKSQHRLNREYYEGIPDSGRRIVISTHAKGVLDEFSRQVSNNPDKLAVKVLSEALGIQKSVIMKYFQKLDKSKEVEEPATEEAAVLNFDLPVGYINEPMNPQ